MGLMVAAEPPREPRSRVYVTALCNASRANVATMAHLTSAMPARTSYEQTILTIWGDVLGCSGFGVNDDFFELGGHSLLAPKVVSRIRKTLGVQIPVIDFFQAPTVAALADAVARHAAADAAEPDGTAAAAVRSVGRRPPDAEPVLSFD